MGLGTWESYLTNHIEGFFNKRFSSNLEVAELMNGIEKEVARQASGLVLPSAMSLIFICAPMITIVFARSASSMRSAQRQAVRSSCKTALWRASSPSA